MKSAFATPGKTPSARQIPHYVLFIRSKAKISLKILMSTALLGWSLPNLAEEIDEIIVDGIRDSGGGGSNGGTYFPPGGYQESPGGDPGGHPTASREEDNSKQIPEKTDCPVTLQTSEKELGAIDYQSIGENSLLMTHSFKVNGAYQNDGMFRGGWFSRYDVRLVFFIKTAPVFCYDRSKDGSPSDPGCNNINKDTLDHLWIMIEGETPLYYVFNTTLNKWIDRDKPNASAYEIVQNADLT